MDTGIVLVQAPCFDGFLATQGLKVELAAVSDQVGYQVPVLLRIASPELSIASLNLPGAQNELLDAKEARELGR